MGERRRVRDVKLNLMHKLIVTVVKKGNAKIVINASKKAGAEGGTVLYGRGFGINEKDKFFGIIPLTHAKEIVLTMVPTTDYMNVLKAIENDAELNIVGKGMGFAISLQSILGVCHLDEVEELKESKESGDSMNKQDYDLIITIVNKGDSENVVEASKRAGAEGGTILTGRGTGIHEQAKLFNIQIEPEKEIVLTLIKKEICKNVLQSISEEVKLNEPGRGIAFVLDVERVVGINHLLKSNEMGH